MNCDDSIIIEKSKIEYSKITKSENIRSQNVLIAGNSDIEYENKLKELDLNVLKTVKADFLYDSIAYHPDIVIHPLDDKNFLVEKTMLEYYGDLFKNIDVNLIPTGRKFTSEYPGYAGLNIGRIGNYYIHNTDYTDIEALKQFEMLGLESIKTKQGYSKCSTLTLSETAVITTDRGIEKAVKSKTDFIINSGDGDNKNNNNKNESNQLKHKMDVLYINPEGIRLDGMNYGFIGGCGGMISEKELVLTGRFDHLADSEKIERFLYENEIDVIYLSEKGINDIGGIIRVGE